MNPKPLPVLFLSIALAGAACAQNKPQAADADIKARGEAFAAAWNKHDAKALAALWTTDGDLIDPFGAATKGRADIEKFFAGQHTGVMKPTTYTITGQTVRMLKPDVAVADWDVDLTGMKTADGKDAPVLKHHVTVVLTKEATQWLVVAARPVIYAPTPGTGTAPKPAK